MNVLHNNCISSKRFFLIASSSSLTITLSKKLETSVFASAKTSKVFLQSSWLPKLVKYFLLPESLYNSYCLHIHKIKLIFDFVRLDIYRYSFFDYVSFFRTELNFEFLHGFKLFFVHYVILMYLKLQYHKIMLILFILVLWLAIFLLCLLQLSVKLCVYYSILNYLMLNSL